MCAIPDEGPFALWELLEALHDPLRGQPEGHSRIQQRDGLRRADFQRTSAHR